MFTIKMLNGFAWENAIMNGVKRLRQNARFSHFTMRENWNDVEEFLEWFDVKFDENGEFMKL